MKPPFPAYHLTANGKVKCISVDLFVDFIEEKKSWALYNDVEQS
jgi:hypothetical protein